MADIVVAPSAVDCAQVQLCISHCEKLNRQENSLVDSMRRQLNNGFQLDDIQQSSLRKIVQRITCDC